LGFLERFRDIVEFDCDFEFAPAGFVDFEGSTGRDVVDHCGLLVHALGGERRDETYFADDSG
jgi:hypothetical protein